MKLRKNRTNAILIGIIALFWLAFSLALPFRLVGDDPHYFTALATFHGNLFAYLVHVYQTWSSRLVGEALNVLLVHHIRLWQLIEATAFTLISVLPAYFFKTSTENRARILLVSFALSFSFPITLIYHAGYVATTVHYLFPFACLLLAIFPFIRQLNVSKNPKALWLISFLAFIYAVLEQQTLVILLLFFAGFLLYSYLQKKNYRLALLYFILAVLSLIFSLTAPGNQARTLAETKAYFPNFAQLPLTAKLNMGFSSVMTSVFTNSWILPLIFLLALFILLLQQGKILKALIILPPIIFNIIISFDSSSFMSKLTLSTHSGMMTRLLFIFINMNKANNTANPIVTSALTNLIFFILTACIFYAIYSLFDNLKQALLPILILLTGFLTKFMMGFFPSVWVSGTRTATFLLYSFSFALLVILQQLNNNEIAQ